MKTQHFLRMQQIEFHLIDRTTIPITLYLEIIPLISMDIWTQGEVLSLN